VSRFLLLLTVSAFPCAAYAQDTDDTTLLGVENLEDRADTITVTANGLGTDIGNAGQAVTIIEREILPLGLSYSPTTLMLVGWCLLREDYRTFEVARMDALHMGATSFRPRRVELLRRYQAMRMAEWEAQKAAEKQEAGRQAVNDPPPPNLSAD